MYFQPTLALDTKVQSAHCSIGAQTCISYYHPTYIQYTWRYISAWWARWITWQTAHFFYSSLRILVQQYCFRFKSWFLMLDAHMGYTIKLVRSTGILYAVDLNIEFSLCIDMQTSYRKHLHKQISFNLFAYENIWLIHFRTITCDHCHSIC